MDKKTTLSLLVLICFVFVASFGVVKLTADASNSKPVACSGKHTAYTAMVQNDTVTPAHTDAKLCATLTIVNRDPVTREIAFGPHENHVPYDGVAEKILKQDQKFTITLNQTGSYRFHDHEHDEVQGTFTVKK